MEAILDFFTATFLAHVEEMEVLWIMTQGGVSGHLQKNSAFFSFFSRLNFIAPGLYAFFTI